MNDVITGIFAKYLQPEMTVAELAPLIEIPSNEKLGDFALPCFQLAKKLRKSPVQIAAALAGEIRNEPVIAEVQAVSGYVNIFLNKEWFSAAVLGAALGEHFGGNRLNETVVVEYCSPNTNKPLHLGHLRNMAIGESVSRLLAYQGNTVNKTCVYNDRGVHICKSMLAYRDFGQGATPEAKGVKSDHFVGDYYVRFAQTAKEDESYELKAQELLEQWESGDPETLSLWRTMNQWAFAGFHETFRLFGICFDREYYESEIYRLGREIILQGLEQGIFNQRDDGAVVADLAPQGLDEKVLLRSNGTSVYIVQDIYLAQLKMRDFSYDRSIYVVGNEQEYHFKVLKEILKLLNVNKRGEIHHLSYGMVELPEGKMKSREGTVVDADNLIGETALLAEAEIRRRYQLADSEVKERAQKIALAAIKFQLLKTETGKNMLFNPKEAIRFEGDTGPYVLYSYARASSILRKSETPPGLYGWAINQSEARLLKKIYQFPEYLKLAGERLTPSTLAMYSLELCQAFNEFYHECPVLHSEYAKERVALVAAFRNVAGKCLDLLGIDKIETM